MMRKVCELKIGRIELADLFFGELLIEDELFILCKRFEGTARGRGRFLRFVLFGVSPFEEELDRRS